MQDGAAESESGIKSTVTQGTSSAVVTDVTEVVENTMPSIAVSYTHLTGEVKLCSVYRDTYMNLGNDKYSKCNAAYASGGPEQAISMLNMNLDMNITDYVSIGFNGMIDVVNSCLLYTSRCV